MKLATDRGHPREEAAQRSPQAGPQAEDQLENLLRGRQEKLRRRQARRRRQCRRRKRSKTAGVDVIKLFFRLRKIIVTTYWSQACLV
jgi:hypothetical protein